MKLFKKGILIIHGFAGGVYEQEYLFKHLQVIGKFDVFNFTLPGHDYESVDKITADDWISSACCQMDFLIANGYKEIYVIGHSMGGVIATFIAGKYKEVKKLVLLAPAFRVFGFEEGTIDVESGIKKIPKLVEQYGSKVITKKFIKLPHNFIDEFFNLITSLQETPKRVYCPTLILRGNDDNVVPEEAVKYVYNNIQSTDKKLIHYDNTTHDILLLDTKDKVTKDIIKFLN